MVDFEVIGLASPITLSFGSLPVEVEPEASSRLAMLPWSALARVLSAIRSWASRGGVKRIRVCTFHEPEDSAEAWEVVLEISVDGDISDALRRWKTLATAVDEAKAKLPEDARRLLNKHLSTQLIWG